MVRLKAHWKAHKSTELKYSEPYRGAVAIQRLMLQDAEKDVKPQERAAIARAYAELEEMKRKLAMRPLPKSIDVTKQQRPSRRTSKRNWSEPDKESTQAEGPSRHPQPPGGVAACETQVTPLSPTDMVPRCPRCQTAMVQQGGLFAWGCVCHKTPGNA